MTFLNPWALIGLAGLAIPIAVHFLARESGPRTRFPTLRFFEVTRIVSLRRKRLSDVPLLFVRLAIIAAAVLALAQPRLNAIRPGLGSARPALAIVLDTSASMSRPVADGRRASEVARVEADELQRDADRHVIIDAADLRAGVTGAIAWLHGQSGARQLAIVSDFQRGAIARDDLSRVPPEIGVHTVRIAAIADSHPAMPPVWRADGRGALRELTPHLTLSPDRTDVRWTPAGPDTAVADINAILTLVAGPREAPRAIAALHAVVSEGARLGSAERPVAMIFAQAATRGSLLDHATPLDRAWMPGVVRALSADAALAAAARAVHQAEAPAVRTGAGLVPVVRDASNVPIVAAASGDVGGAHRLLLFVDVDAGSLVSALLIDATLRATDDRVPAGELESSAIDASELRQSERPPAPALAPPDPSTTDSAGRWIWGVVLLLLALEWWVRGPQSAPASKAAGVAYDRVA